LTEKTIVKGNVKGKVLKSSQPINFLGSIDKKTGSITDMNMICLVSLSRIASYYFPTELAAV